MVADPLSLEPLAALIVTMPRPRNTDSQIAIRLPTIEGTVGDDASRVTCCVDRGAARSTQSRSNPRRTPRGEEAPTVCPTPVFSLEL